MRLDSLRSLGAYAIPRSVFAALKRKSTSPAPIAMPRRTIRKLTCWHADEWARVEDAARARGVPPLRYVREAALGAPPPPRRRRVRDELVRQLGRVLNNVRQLQRAAEIEGLDVAARRIERTAEVTEAAICLAPPPGTATREAVQWIVEAGRALNEVTHRAHSDEEIPPRSEVEAALREVERSMAWIF